MTTRVALTACALTVGVVVVCFVALSTLEESSSTAGIGLIFTVFLGGMAILVIWVIAFIVAIARRPRSSS
jgi:hypothetical protein